MSLTRTKLILAALLAGLASSPAWADLSPSGAAAHAAWSTPLPGWAAERALLQQIESVVPPGSPALKARELAAPFNEHAAIEDTLWTFVRCLRAQHAGKPFEILVARLEVIKSTVAAPVSQVPLPASAWLMLMGLLGLAGVRVTGAQGRQAAGGPAPAYAAA